MGKVGIKNIAAVLATKKNLSPEEAEKYVDAFFSLVNEALIPDKIVKIKGFGTFKLIDVRDRESVDVNTGERMVIDGHSKITFAPDNTLKELVNKPFSQFETVVLNDGVDFDKEMEEFAEAEVEAETMEAAEAPVTAEAPETVEAPETTEATETTEFPVASAAPAASETPETPSASDPSLASVPPVLPEVPAVPVAPAPPKSSEDNIPPSSDDTEPSPIVEEPILPSQKEEQTLPFDSVLPDTPDTDESPEKPSRHFIKYVYAFAAVVVMAAVFYGGYYFGANNEPQEVQPKVHVVVKQVRKPVAKKTKPVEPQPVAENSDSIALAAENEDKAEAVKPEEKKNDTPSAPETTVGSDLELAQRMVQTGAYVIDGLAQSVKVKPGQTISSISKFYLGEGMECYVKVYNKRTVFKEGDIVNIPKLRLKKKAANNKVS